MHAASDPMMLMMSKPACARPSGGRDVEALQFADLVLGHRVAGGEERLARQLRDAARRHPCLVVRRRAARCSRARCPRVSRARGRSAGIRLRLRTSVVVPQSGATRRLLVRLGVDRAPLGVDDRPAALGLDRAVVGLRRGQIGAETRAMRRLVEAIPHRLRADPHRLEEDVVLGVAAHSGSWVPCDEPVRQYYSTPMWPEHAPPGLFSSRVALGSPAAM